MLHNYLVTSEIYKVLGMLSGARFSPSSAGILGLDTDYERILGTVLGNIRG